MKKLIVLLLIGLFVIPAYANQGRSVKYQINNQFYEGYFVSPSQESPVVFLIHDWDGLTEYEKKRAHMLADLGYTVFAIDLFGEGVRPTEVKDKRQHTGELYKDREKMRSLMNSAFEKAKSLGADTTNAVAAGYCFGGAAVLEWARSGKNLKGFVTFHGGLKTPENQDYNNTTGHILVFHGSADTAITMDEFAGLAKELESAKVSHEMITYSGAPHAFTVFGSDRYQEKADKASWSRFLSFLNDTFK
jgi:dienelactone hydrolase